MNIHTLLTFKCFIAEDLFKDLQEEFRNWEDSAGSQGKPKSLWEELAVRDFLHVKFI